MNKAFRKIHLWLSVPVGLIITIICLTGAVLVFERDITENLDPHLYKVPYTQGDTILPPSQIAARIRSQVPDSLRLLSLQLPGEKGAACMARFEGKGKRSLSVNPYTGEINGWTKPIPFFQTMRKLHRWLMDAPAYKGAKSTGKAIVGITTLLMVVILVSGVVIWVPRTRKALRSRLTISCRKGWRRFWYDSHVSLGIYATLFLLVMALTGLTWSFSWYRTAAYSLFGVSTSHTPPPSKHNGKVEKEKEQPQFTYKAWDNVVAELRTHYPNYKSILLTRENAQIYLSGNGPDYDIATFDKQTGAVEEITLYSDLPKSKKMKSWFYAFHTGSWGGTTTQILYFLSALIGAILPISGYYLWLRKKHPSVRKR